MKRALVGPHRHLDARGPARKREPRDVVLKRPWLPLDQSRAPVADPEAHSDRIGGRAGGRDLDRQAFTHNEQQRTEREPKAHAELGVLASLEIGLHAQTRLQEEIAEALNAPFVTQEQLG